MSTSLDISIRMRITMTTHSNLNVRIRTNTRTVILFVSIFARPLILDIVLLQLFVSVLIVES